jgi:hypothetical protein
MEYLIVIFGLGVAVSLIVMKGIFQAEEFTKAELDRRNDEGKTQP